MRLLRGALPAFFLLSTLGLSAAITLPGHSGVMPGQADTGATIRLPAVCGVLLTGPRLDGSLPSDVEGALRQENHNVVQRASDIFSWQEFLTLNWPAQKGKRGQPDLQQPIETEGARLWETWKETQEVYHADGSEPADWNSPSAPPVTPAPSDPFHISESAHYPTATLQAVQADGTLPPTLTDRHGHVVRYEVRMNRVLFDFIRTKGLYNGNKQAAQEAISFPNGSMLIKASWRELERGEEARFLTVNAWLYDLKNGKPTRWRLRKMGLIGLHIVQKTPSAPQWIWSTFEQIDNVGGRHPSFRTRDASPARANRQTKPGVPNQVTRVLPISGEQPACNQPMEASDNVQALNQAVQQELARRKSVLQYYELVNTQWPLPAPEGSAPVPDTVVHAQPPIVANATMETFAQDASTCMGCHAMARSSRTDRFVSADFTFTLTNARPVQTNTQTIPPPEQPLTQWDRQNWAAIQRGKKLTERTYETLPEFTHAKLHCGSCHLDAGLNPDSAWWVGMTVKYPTLEKLQGRVNQCFERSMNGQAIPTAESWETLAQTAPEMHAFLTYMLWMDEQYQAKHSAPARTGLVVLPPQVGDAGRGQEIFLQKCAVCHGKEGAGRYEHNTYFRPALWGDHSFNTLAGMDKPEKLAAFLKTNMPFGSGGVLTLQEAWDLAAFLPKQRRPIKIAQP